MEPRIRPPKHERNVEGADVLSTQQDPSLLERQFASAPGEIPEQAIGEERVDSGPQLTPVHDHESTTLETMDRKPGLIKRLLGAAAVFVALTGVVVGAKTGAIKFDSGNETVATSSAFPTTTPPKAVAVPPRHEAPTTTPDALQTSQVYTLSGELQTLEQMKNGSFTITKAEAPTLRAAAENLGPMLKAVANFGIHEANEGITGNNKKSMAEYNNKQLLNTDMLTNTGLTDSGMKPNLLEILVKQNEQNTINRTFTQPDISNIRIGSTSTMNGKSTTTVEATLKLMQPPRGSKYGPVTTYELQCYISDTGGDNWIIERGSFGLIPA